MDMKWEWTGEPAFFEDIKSDVGKGWGNILDRLIVDLEKLGWDGVVTQVKEKFGGLRFYIGSGTQEIWERVSQAERESEGTCQECGKPGTIDKWGKWWLLCLCPEHGEERRNSKI